MSTTVQSAATAAAMAGEREVNTVHAVKTGDRELDLMALCLSAVRACHLAECESASVFAYLAKRFAEDWAQLERSRAQAALGGAISESQNQKYNDLLRQKEIIRQRQAQIYAASGSGMSSPPPPSMAGVVSTGPFTPPPEFLSDRDLDSSCGP